MTDNPSYLKVWLKGEEYIILSPDDEPRINAAVSQYIDSGKTVDTLLDLTLIDGVDTYTTIASEISSWFVSTLAGRRKNEEFNKAMGAEFEEAQTPEWEE